MFNTGNNICFSRSSKIYCWLAYGNKTRKLLVSTSESRIISNLWLLSATTQRNSNFSKLNSRKICRTPMKDNPETAELHWIAPKTQVTGLHAILPESHRPKQRYLELGQHIRRLRPRAASSDPSWHSMARDTHCKQAGLTVAESSLQLIRPSQLSWASETSWWRWHFHNTNTRGRGSRALRAHGDRESENQLSRGAHVADEIESASRRRGRRRRKHTRETRGCAVMCRDRERESRARATRELASLSTDWLTEWLRGGDRRAARLHRPRGSFTPTLRSPSYALCV